MSSNGHLSRSELAPITVAADGRQAYLRRDCAGAFMAMNAESEKRFGVTLRATSARCAYREFAEQVYFKNLQLYHGGALAATPGYSNHGLGLAIDLATYQMRIIVDKIGRKYGFAKAWSDAPTEWWHLKWRPGSYKAVREYRKWKDFTPLEKKVITRYDSWYRRKVNKKGRQKDRQWMIKQRKAIWHAAQKTGWGKYNRRARYNALLRRTS